MRRAAARSASCRVPALLGPDRLSALGETLRWQALGPITEREAPPVASRVVYKALANDAEPLYQRCLAMRAALQNVDVAVSRPAAWKPVAARPGTVHR
jgi:hypothetical protein